MSLVLSLVLASHLLDPVPAMKPLDLPSLWMQPEEFVTKRFGPPLKREMFKMRGAGVGSEPTDFVRLRFSNIKGFRVVWIMLTSSPKKTPKVANIMALMPEKMTPAEAFKTAGIKLTSKEGLPAAGGGDWGEWKSVVSYRLNDEDRKVLTSDLATLVEICEVTDATRAREKEIKKGDQYLSVFAEMKDHG